MGGAHAKNSLIVWVEIMRNWGFAQSSPHPGRLLAVGQGAARKPLAKLPPCNFVAGVFFFEKTKLKTTYPSVMAKTHFGCRPGQRLTHSAIDWEDVVYFFERAFIRRGVQRFGRTQADEAETREALQEQVVDAVLQRLVELW